MAKRTRKTEGGTEKDGERKWIIPEERERLTKKQIKELFLKQDGRCVFCTQSLQVKGHMPVEFIDEHMIPLSIGGSNALENRALLCKPCAGTKTKAEATERAKGNRAFEKMVLGVKPKRGGFRGHRKFDGTIVWKK